MIAFGPVPSRRLGRSLQEIPILKETIPRRKRKILMSLAKNCWNVPHTTS
jgi:hypothetical protein